MIFVLFKRILVATNLFGRGMDIERVNIVFNYDMPEDSDTYLHRVARAGRFGTKVCNSSVNRCNLRRETDSTCVNLKMFFRVSPSQW